ncbi:MAG TPA: cyanophycin synthetase [Candidatus Paceibacterota bacterium]|nr:cyanophycin synthetase [Candidatus Paceibacterota bacterium]
MSKRASRMKEPSLIGRVLKKVAPKIGAKVTLEPEWNVAGQITFKNGMRSYFRYNSIGVNALGASEISKDKDYAAFFMDRLGYPVIPGKTFFRDDFRKILGSNRGVAAACAYARRLGFPVIAKPNSQSQGRGVFLVHDVRELRRALARIFMLDKVALIQPFVKGDDYRIVVLDDNIISAYVRVPLSVTGDGHSSIRELLRKKQRAFVADGRDTKLDPKDPRILQGLRRDRLSLRSVLPQGKRVQLLPNANLSSGGEALDVTRTLHPSLKKAAIRVTKDMGLRLCGVDLLVISRKGKKPSYHIIEINSAPGLDHYAQSGKAQERIVEDLYLKVLKRMGKRS